MKSCQNCKQPTVCVTSGQHETCTECGLTQEVAYNMVEQRLYAGWGHINFANHYSREKRFGHLFDRLVWPTPEPKDAPCIHYLSSKKNIKDHQDILKVMKMAPLKDKRYCSIHLFCKLFLKQYTPPPVVPNIFQFRKQLIHEFKNLEWLHTSSVKANTPFFSYPWLLQKLLCERGLTSYTVYIKKIKCKRRNKHYEKMFARLRAIV